MLDKTATLFKFTPVLLIVLGFLFIGLFALRNSPVYLMSMFTIADEPTTYSFNSYDRLLKEFVHEGLVDYQKLSKSKLLDKCMGELSRSGPKKLSKEGQVCYWINAYNLIILKIIADKYPIKILHQVGTDRASRKFIVGGKVLSAQNILAREVEPRLARFRQAPEAVFLICGGTLNYPPITDHAIVPKTLEVDSRVAAFKYITNKKNVFFDKEQGIFFLSSLMKKYESTFEAVGHTPYSFTTLYLDPSDTPDLGDIMLTKTYFSKVDYRVNDYKLVQRAGKKDQKYAIKIKQSKTENKDK